jgi:hypothetical protein
LRRPVKPTRYATIGDPRCARGPSQTRLLARIVAHRIRILFLASALFLSIEPAVALQLALANKRSIAAETYRD